MLIYDIMNVKYILIELLISRIDFLTSDNLIIDIRISHSNNVIIDIKNDICTSKK